MKGIALGLHLLEIFVYIFTAIALPFKWLTRSQPLSQCLAAVVSTLTISDKKQNIDVTAKIYQENITFEWFC